VKNQITIRRRVKSTAYIIISQFLLIALAVAWAIHMIIIAKYGSVYFVENNPVILWAEIIASIIIAVFAALILSTQIQRLGERRKSDRKESGTKKWVR
jgi:membrane protein implicated in regulation of membrane protease activity